MILVIFVLKTWTILQLSYPSIVYWKSFKRH